MKTEQQIRETVSENLTFFRKKCGFTQPQVAEKINYSDKSVSKWERAEGIPDFYVLTQLAEIYGVSVADFLCSDPEKAMRKAQRKSEKFKLVITALAVGLVWLIASIVYFSLTIVGISQKNLSVVYFSAVPVSAVVLTVFTNLWFKHRYSVLSVSLLIWSLAAEFYWFFKIPGMNYLFEIAAVLQILVILWYVLLRIKSKEKKK